MYIVHSLNNYFIIELPKEFLEFLVLRNYKSSCSKVLWEICIAKTAKTAKTENHLKSANINKNTPTGEISGNLQDTKIIPPSQMHFQDFA